VGLDNLYRRARESYLFLKCREIKYRLTYMKSSKRMAEAIERFKKCDNKKPKSQIKREINLCKKFWGCYPAHYYRGDLYRKDRQLSNRELLNYIPEFFFYGLFLPFYNLNKYVILLEDKIITEQFFRSLAIRQPHTICKLINHHIYTNELIEKSFNTIKQELREAKYKKVFVKPAEGRGGYGIYVFHRCDGTQYVSRDNEVFNEDFLNKIGTKNDYIIQASIEQALEISKIYPHSVNTFRIVTEHKNRDVRILYVELRLGRSGDQIDSCSQNGLCISIDVNTGAMNHYATSEKCEYFKKHPDTNFVFEKAKITNWNKIKEFVIECAKKSSQFTYLGWDIALSKNGPLAIEANPGFALDCQILSGGWREIFQISDPQFYWRNRGKRGSF